MDMLIDFDEKVDRRGTNAHKWDSSDDKEMIPLWVADMDFKAAPVIVDAIKRRADHGVFGYVHVDDEYYNAVTGWFRRRHKWDIKREQILYTTGVIPGLTAVVKALTNPGDGIIIQPPVYNCFFSSIRNNDCMIIENKLHRIPVDRHIFTFNMDYEDLERKCKDANNKLMILCNPHNPAGRNWSRGELERVFEICSSNGVRVISDEIHCELTAPGTGYVAYGTIDKSAVVLCSPSKSFNIAGLHLANIICPDETVKIAVDKAITANEACGVNPFGVDALKAAYSNEGEEWLDQLRVYIDANYRYMCGFLAENLPQCPVSLLEATYLPVIDVQCLGVSSVELEQRLKEEAHVWVNASEMYGRTGYLRINIACPRAQLSEGLDRLVKYLRTV